MSEKIITYWTNFVKFNNPNYVHKNETEYWEPFVVDKSQLENITNSGGYLVFENNSIQMVKGYSSHNCIFWNYTASPMSNSCFKFGSRVLANKNQVKANKNQFKKNKKFLKIIE